MFANFLPRLSDPDLEGTATDQLNNCTITLRNVKEMRNSLDNHYAKAIIGIFYRNTKKT